MSHKDDLLRAAEILNHYAEEHPKMDYAALASRLREAADKCVCVPRAVPVAFENWLAHQMPPNTIISDPLWWAPRIYRAMIAAAPGGEE